MAYTVLIVDDSKLARMAVIKTLAAVEPNWGRVLDQLPTETDHVYWAKRRKRLHERCRGASS
jgi:hypothetical protein